MLSDSLSATSPWRDDPVVSKDAAELAIRLGVAWKIDRELVGRPILIPNGREQATCASFLEGKVIRPDAPGDPKSSIREVDVKGLGWMSFDGLRSHSASCGYGLSRKPPLVTGLLVDYQVIDGNGCGSVTMTPGEYRILEKRYLAQQQDRENPQPSQPLDDLKQEARVRAQSHLQSHSATKPTKPLDYAL